MDEQMSLVLTPLDESATRIEWNGQPVLTTEQLANFYECSADNIKKNYSNNKERFVEGKHYFKLEGENLKQFKRDLVNNIHSVNFQINDRTPSLMLWTKQGAARHAKMLSTEKAWEVFEHLEETYFNVQKILAAANIVQSMATVKPATVINDIGDTRDAIMRVFGGVKDGIALAQAINLNESYYGRDLQDLKVLLPPAEHQTGFMNPTQIGEKIGELTGKILSAQVINQMLKEKGLQTKPNKKNWRLTDEGKNYGEEYPFERNGHAGYHIQWNEEIVQVLLEAQAH